MADSAFAASNPARPAWVPDDLYPFADHYADIHGSRVHYVDEGSGPTLLLLHGNPTWSFLYREIIAGLRDSYRCIAVDYPGFGLSTASPAYRHTAAEHAGVLEQLVLRLDLTDVTMMVQDWGGPIGFAVAVRHPERFSAFVVANTWAWPKSDLRTRAFSHALGGAVGRRLIANRNVFVERILPLGARRATLSWTPTAGPFPRPRPAGPRPSSRASCSPPAPSSPKSNSACRCSATARR